MKWFRMYSEFANDPKVQSMSEPMQRRLVMLLCLRSCDVLETLQPDDIAFHLRITPEDLLDTHAMFVRKGFIDTDWNILNWDKRQYVSDTSTYRTRKYRERQRNVTGTSQERCCDGLDTDTDTDTDTEKNKNIVPHAPHESPPNHKNFVRPSLDEVAAYCSERGNSIDARKWFDHYTANGWKVGRNPMKDWKAAVRTWERTQLQSAKQTKAEKTAAEIQKWLKGN